MTFPLSWQNCNPKRLPLPPNKYVTVILVHSTKSGFVYVISNIGSFGERVIKIGMTRRMEPI